MAYEKLLNEAYELDVDVYERPMSKRNRGLYADNVIWINKNIETTAEKSCVLAEELGHYHTTVGNILNQSSIDNVKQEKQARKWASKKLVTPGKLVDAFNVGCRSKFEVAEYMNITEEFLEDTLKFYKEKYGTELQVDDDHTLFLEPLAVYKRF